jgi:dephospho-CoA kinase
LEGPAIDEYISAESGSFHDEYLKLRSKLRKIVVNDFKKRELLESVVHPAVERLYIAKRKEIARKDSSSIIVYHAPLLIEAYLKDHPNLQKEGFKELSSLDIVVLVYTRRSVALERAAIRAHPPIDEAVKLMDAQLPYEDKARFAEHIIDNNYDFETTRTEVKRVFNLIKLLSPKNKKIEL